MIAPPEHAATRASVPTADTSTGAAPLLEVRGLTVRIGGREVCRDLDLELRAGERLAILGRNGAGKTTLLHTLAGMRAPDAGEIRYAGQALERLSPRAAALRRGLLAQHAPDALGCTVMEAVLTGRHPHLGRWQWESGDDERIARAALEELGLTGLEGRECATLSGGERQRLALATLLAQAPPLMLLDEPLTHLDLNHQMAALALFARLAAAAHALVLVLHEPSLAARHCERALLLYPDGTAECGGSQDVVEATRLSRLYEHPMHELLDRGERLFLPDTL